MAMTEQQIALAANAMQGDEQSFSQLYQLYYQKVYALAFQTLKNAADAEDVLQITFIKAWKSISRLNDPAAFNTWIQRIAVNECTTLLRRRKPDYSIDNNDEEDGIPIELESDLMIPEVYAEREDLSERMRQVIFSLSEVQRQTIVLFYFDEHSISEIAEIMRCGENTVKSRLYLARKAMKAEIEEQERKTGTKFYGIPLLPFGSIFVRQLSKNALSPSRAAALYSNIYNASVAVSGGSATAASASAASATAAGAAAGSKVMIGVLIVMIAVGAGVLGFGGVKLFQMLNGNKADVETTAAATESIPETTAPTAATEAQPTTEAPTQAPTEPDYSKAYHSYLEVLQDQQVNIEAFNWGNKPYGSENDSIAFVDVGGDATPEMIYIYADSYKKNPYDSNNQGKAKLAVVSYLDGAAKTVYETEEPHGWYQNEAGGEMQYAVFTVKNEKAIYYHTKGANEYGTRKYVRISFDNGMNAAEETVYTTDDRENPDATAKELEIAGSVDTVLSRTPTVSMPSLPQGSSLTYEEAVAFLKGAGGASGQREEEDPASIFGKLSGQKLWSRGGGFSVASFDVKADGSFTYLSRSGNTPLNSYSGSFNGVSKISDICYQCRISSDNSSINGHTAYIYLPTSSLDELPEDAAQALIDHISVGFGNRSKAEQKLSDPIGYYFIVVESFGIAFIGS